MSQVQRDEESDAKDVTRQLKTLASYLANLDKDLCVLDERLMPIMFHVPEDAKTSDETYALPANPSHCQIASMIIDLQTDVVVIDNVIKRITRDLQV